LRSAAEIRFRLRQETANLYLLLAQPQFTGQAEKTLALPDGVACVAALRGSEFEAKVIDIAEQIMVHRFPLLGTALETGPQIDWRRDYAHNKTSEAKYFRLVKYLNFAAVGDHKFIWELNRHQHLVLLAQAHLFNGKAEYMTEINAELESWFEQNPFQRGINWASALEVAFRALSWIWLWHFCGDSLPRWFLTSLYQHGRHLYENLSVYFSPNTHLLGEAVALHALGTLFSAFPDAAEWQRRGAEVVEKQLKFQVKADGSHFEQSTYYHVYALDFFVFYYLLAGKPERMKPTLIRMAEYLFALLGPARRIAYFGDDDGGRLFHPQGERDAFGRATLATCGVLLNREKWLGNGEELAEQAVWWLGADALARARPEPRLPEGSKVFPDAGTVFLQSDEVYVQFDAGPFGWGGAGHSHADSLSLVVWHQGKAVFTDPGTFTYMADPEERDRFRGTRAHNTVTIDGLNQAQTAGPFRWNEKPKVQLESFVPSPCGGFIDATCTFGQFQHRRRLLLNQKRIFLLDEINGPPGDHTIEQVWNLGEAADKVHLSFSHATEVAKAEHSKAYGAKTETSAIVVRVNGALPVAIAMCLDTHDKTEIAVRDLTAMFNNEVT